MPDDPSHTARDLPPLRERNRLRVREEIGRAGRRLFVTEGYAATPVERVAEEAGVSVRTVFRHFPRKEDIVFYRHADAVERLGALLAAAPADRPSLDVVVESLMRVVGVGEAGPEEEAAMVRLLETEPDLRHHESRLAADHTATIAAFLEMRLGGGPDARARAALLTGALMGVLRAARAEMGRAEGVPAASRYIGDAVALLRHLPFP